MKPVIKHTKFGSITVENEEYYFDIVINKSGEVKKRDSSISKKIYGTSHKVSLEEIQMLYEDQICMVIFGNGQSGKMVVSQEALSFLKEKKCEVKIKKTPDAIEEWNKSNEATIGLFHVTC
jgi:hypothetical protein